ncbi:MAG: cobalt ABC transporter permease [Desulfuromonas sp.]|nr:MAG: cobalt ABC transporter permease [Desulfuromonas sp.]
MKKLLIILIAPVLMSGFVFADEAKPEKWAGIDEAVVEKYAADKGREAAEPLFNVEGDMLLFLFALAGTIGGFVMGFYWHKVFVVGQPEGEGDR